MPGFYSFLPYLRQGLNNYLTNADSTGGTSSPKKRPTFDLSVKLNATAVGGGVFPTSADKTFALKSPCDVTGINSNAIVKVSPADWVTNFEPNYLPYIEFFDEDFCWRYTPAKFRDDAPGQPTQYKVRLRPWITLVVLKEGEFQAITAANGKNAIKVLKTPSDIFPKQEELWAWAHVHVNENLSNDDNPIGNNITTAVNNFKNILSADPDKAVSRLISPRRLEPNTGYTAFLIPTFESGRLAGLGQDPFGGTPMADMLDGAWKATTPVGTEYPVYYSWYFKTGAAGDFESLVRMLKPKILGEDVGKREMDLQKSNNDELESIQPPYPAIYLQGVVQPVSAISDSWDTTDNNAYAAKMREIVNEPTKILEAHVTGDPIIAPPIYGRWHAARSKVDAVTSSPDWLQEVNLDPRYRIFAGAGTETIRRNQEKYMDIAWEQIGEVVEANRKLRQLQISRQANLAMYNKHLVSLNDELLLNISAPVHQRIRNNPQTATVYKDIGNSAIPVTMLSGAFRRLTRPGGMLVSNIEATTNTVVTTTDLIADVNSGTVQPSYPVQAPAGQLNYNIWNSSQLTPSFTFSLQPNAGFQFANPGMVVSGPAPGPNAPATQMMVNAIGALHGVIQALPSYNFSTNPALPLPGTRNIILTRTQPYTNALQLAQNTIKLSNVAGAAVNVPDTNFVMAAPRIKMPMYSELAALSPDWIMPGLNNIEMNSINMLQVNQKYVEAYMLGLNYEMGRELLWRGYPTDQRGTCFSYFWGYSNSVTTLLPVIAGSRVFNLQDYRDIEDIHRWRIVPNNPSSALKTLGSNNARSAMSGVQNMLILTIRGELLRKYPGTIIYLQESEWITFDEPRKLKPDTEKYPVFTGHIEPDIYLLGFAVDPDAVRGEHQDVNHPGYFVVFQERAGEIRFGADEASTNPPSTTIATWDDVNWGLIKNDPAQDGFIDMTKTFTVTDNPDSVTWNNNSAMLAYALLQSPVKLNVHAEGLIPAPNT